MSDIISATTNVTIRMDKQLKKDAETMFNNFGMNLSTAIQIFLRQSLREGKIPFEIGYVTNAETLAALREADELTKRPDTKYYKNFDEIMAEAKQQLVAEAKK